MDNNWYHNHYDEYELFLISKDILFRQLEISDPFFDFLESLFAMKRLIYKRNLDLELKFFYNKLDRYLKWRDEL